MKVLLLLAVAAVTLGGCMTAEQRLARDQQSCAGYGFRPGTEAFAQCMMNVDQGRKNRLAAAAAANLASPTTCVQTGNVTNCY
jgi:hypothetical protein